MRVEGRTERQGRKGRDGRRQGVYVRERVGHEHEGGGCREERSCEWVWGKGVEDVQDERERKKSMSGIFYAWGS